MKIIDKHFKTFIYMNTASDFFTPGIRQSLLKQLQTISQAMMKG